MRKEFEYLREYIENKQKELEDIDFEMKINLLRVQLESMEDYLNTNVDDIIRGSRKIRFLNKKYGNDYKKIIQSKWLKRKLERKLKEKGIKIKKEKI